ncbi:hypothetical protein HPB49_010684 [Dermacentor silvarum]|uniref:Uncharacterized protein n=1 Tax=Dermacentor silvarum TaxID=543639 RepID=A0ACB8DYU0_DERSI|nr:hypothetical protein HPB49_010684 [Dermacentor silvarum]
MTAKRFLKIRAALHITESNAPHDPTNEDKFWKVRPIIEAVRTWWLEPLEQNSVDEQISFTGHAPAKQFVKGKPNPEVFLRCIKAREQGLVHYMRTSDLADQLSCG